MSHSECKRLTRSLSTQETPPNQDCVAYQLGPDGTLTLKHVNAGFNCCPTEILANISMRNDTITIVERDSLVTPCHCLCLYDLDYRFENFEPGTYTFQFIEPYVTGADAPLTFTVDVVPYARGTYCVERNNYPWGTGGQTTEPFGFLVSRTGCKTAANLPAGEAIPADIDCIEYHYLGNNALGITHINAAFNCCPGEITGDITVANDTIRIVEREEQSICNCSCLYDLVYQIRNLEPHRYVIEVVEPYVQAGEARLVFPIDLAAAPAGFVGRYRGHYPWMYTSTMENDRLVLDRMRTEIIDFIGTPSCGGGEDCRYIALGVKPCGGPWEYVIYSTSTIDVDSLRFMVSRYNTFDDAFNRRYNVASDCRFVLPPRIGCVEGRCSDLDHPNR